jgi:hypothetical protein
MAALTKLLSVAKSKWTHYAVLVSMLLGTVNWTLGIFKDRAQIRADLEVAKLAILNKDKDYQTLKTKYEKLKVWEYTVTHTLPSGETVTTTTRITDSTVGSTEFNSGSEHTNYPNVGTNTPDRLSVSALGLFSTDGWQAGLGYEALAFQLPIIPYKTHGILGIAGGSHWSNANGGYTAAGYLIFQFSRK